MNDIKKIDAEKIAHTYGRFDLALKEGQGAIAKDFDGREYVDFTSGIGVTSLGYCDPDWVEAVSKQAARLQHTSNLFYTEPQVRLAEALTERTGMARVFFANSGAEANECAIKTARKYGNTRSGNIEHEIVTLENAFHGRTMATITATGQKVFHKDFYPFVEGFSYCKANDKDMLHALVTDKTCAIMMELVQGEGGVLVIDQDFVKEAETICREKDILLIIDEVQTGIGRTGTFFAYEQYGIHPDLVTFAKGIGGGLPLGGVLFNERTKDVLTYGDHGTTFGGNPVVCAGANVVMNKLDESFLQQVSSKGAYLREQLAAIPGVEDISGLGLMIGFRVAGRASADVVKDCMKKGLMMLTAKDKVRLLPPLTITKEEMDRGLAVLRSALG
ncbi:MAG: aspartate aminotransferase family protein [Eubacteriales bacterium]|nr:aspartate aminotransferase family protein [Eubacteriales bacterium]